MEHPSHTPAPASGAVRADWRMPACLAIGVALSGVLVAVLSAGAVESPPTFTVSTPPSTSPSTSPSPSTRAATSRADAHDRMGFSRVVKMVRPAVVHIATVTGGGAAETPLYGRPDEFGRRPRGGSFFETPPSRHPERGPRGMGMGSGVIISPDGYVVTNHHVIEGATSVTVTLRDQRVFAGTIVGGDPHTDLAVIHIEGRDLPSVSWGDSATLEVGDYVLAIGHPFGLRSTVTQGIVSAKGRGGMGITPYEDFIQTDAAINPGNSGGALVNMRGELVGINTAILSRTGGSQGVGFAVPANIGRYVHAQLVATGAVTRGFLGVGIQDVTPDLAQSFQLDHPAGAIVTDVRDDSPADRAGLQRGDTIVRYRGQSVADPRDLRHAVTTTAVGTDVAIVVVRDGAEHVARATIAAHPTNQRVADARPSDGASGLAGLAVEALTPQMARRLDADDRVAGVVVTDVRAGSRAEQAGLAPGDIIREVNRRPVPSPEAFHRAVRALTNDHTVVVFIHRRGMSMFLTISV